MDRTLVVKIVIHRSLRNGVRELFTRTSNVCDLTSEKLRYGNETPEK